MDLFLVDINRQLFYLWAKQYKQNNCMYIEETKELKSIHFETNEIIGKVTFWYDGIVEEEVRDKNNKEGIFYLHYQFQNFLQAKKMFEEMMSFVLHSKKQKTIKVLLCCSGGLTTTLFASGLQQYARLSKQNITFDAVGYPSLYEKSRQYDMVLLAPQVAYLEPNTKAMIDVPICCISPTNFATNNFQKTLSMVVGIINKTVDEKEIGGNENG